MLKVTEKYIIAFDKDLNDKILHSMKKDWHLEVLDCDQVKQLEINNTELQETNYLLSSVDFTISFLSPFEKKKSLIEKLKNPKIIIKRREIDNFEKEESLKSVVNEVVQFEKEIKTIEKEIKEKSGKIKELEQFNDLSFIPKETNHTKSLIFKTDKVKEFSEFFGKNKITNREISVYQSKTYFTTIFLKEREEDILNFLKNNSGEIVNYNFKKIPSEERELLSKEIKEKEIRMKEIQKELALKSFHLDDLKIYHDLLCLRKRIVRVKKRILISDFLSYLAFWATKEEKERFEKEVKNISDDIKIIKVQIEKDESPPVFLENSRVISPFQAVTDIFGLPSASEIDPTSYLSLFFIVYFGICITDAGYGFLLALFTGLMLIFFKKSFGKSNLIKLLFYAGISTIIMGVLFGSYFGVSASEIGLPFMQRFKVIDPIKDTLLFMGITFLLGYFQICFAQIVKIISNKNQGNKEGIVSGIVWFCFYLSAGIYLLSIPFAFLQIFGKIGLILFGVGLFLVEGRGQKIFLIPLIGGIKILQGLINTVSDILSYSRLMALGLGTGVIALIVNQIAFLLGGMIPYVGWILTLIILVFGHIFNLGINALGGFIHSARLQFVEFFPKFMEGGGRRLDPIQEELRYIKIN